MDLSLHDIGIKHNTDKAYLHKYLVFYEEHLIRCRYKKIRLLEIGIGGMEHSKGISNNGGSSLRMWGEYFPNAEIFGIDTDKSCLNYVYESDRIKTIIGDQTNRKFLDSIEGEFDIIIDDGGHLMNQQMISFGCLFKKLKQDGVYILENLQTSFLTQYGGNPSNTNTVLSNLNSLKTTRKIDSVHLLPQEKKYIESNAGEVFIHGFHDNNIKKNDVTSIIFNKGVGVKNQKATEKQIINFTGLNTNNRIKKICIVTTFDKHYKEAGKTLFNSIKRHTDCTGIDFKVITSDIDVVNELGKENCHFITEDIKARYNNVKYSKELPVEKYSSSWYRYEIFNMTEYDRVICIDSDCICVEDISYLFSEELNQYDLISVEDYIVSKCFIKLVPELERQGLRLANLNKRIAEGKIDIQPALLVANKTIVNGVWYRKLLNYANTAPFSYSIDEGVLNDFIYIENLKIKLLPLEWDYQDIYEIVCEDLPIPSKPIIVHCQESKPFKKQKSDLDNRMHKWHDLWREESKPIKTKTVVVIIVWNRFENLKRWINCWNECIKMDVELIVVHNLENDNNKYQQLCKDNGIKYIPRENKGFDIGAFQDICKERLTNFPNTWDNLIWITDDCIPMQKDFVQQYLIKLKDGYIPCYEISDVVKRHIRTTGFLITKDISKKLVFPKDPIENREDCYQFEHKSKNAFFEQVIRLGKNPIQIINDLTLSPLWDSGVRGYLNLITKHKEVFPLAKSNVPDIIIDSVLDRIAIKHKSDKSSRYHNYAVKYDKILSPFRESFLSVLEIGVAQGQSIKMWTDYFPNATIHGADISKASEICESYSNRIKFHLLDQRDEAQLKNLEQFSPFDLIIDDGNHFWMEQILTFKTLFPYVKSGGIYIVEDTTTSYWKEYKNNQVSPIEFFKTLVDEVHLKGERGNIPINPPQEFGDWGKGWHRREDCYTSLPLFDSIQFMNGFIVIYKR